MQGNHKIMIPNGQLYMTASENAARRPTTELEPAIHDSKWNGASQCAPKASVQYDCSQLGALELDNANEWRLYGSLKGVTILWFYYNYYCLSFFFVLLLLLLLLSFATAWGKHSMSFPVHLILHTILWDVQISFVEYVLLSIPVTLFLNSQVEIEETLPRQNTQVSSFIRGYIN